MNTPWAQRGIAIFFLIGVCALALWSWVLVDPNFTLIKHADWTRFREFAITIGYHQRILSAHIFVALTLWLTLASYLIVRFYKGSIWFMAIGVGVVAGIFSYPALSHDLFNYIFDARILTYYHENPYVFRPMDFPVDPMLRFMHWIHRTYPYGPSYLLISVVPSFLGWGIFSLTFALFKLMHAMLYVITVWAMSRIQKSVALLFATSPLIIVEGLINTHNDFVALCIALCGAYILLKQKNKIVSFIMLLISGFVKYFSIPALLLSPAPEKIKIGYKGKEYETFFPTWIGVFIGLLAPIAWVSLKQEVQSWYFLNLFIVLPYAPWIFTHFSIFFTGLLLSYYPYVIGGEWGQGGDIGIKHKIICWGFILNVIWLAIQYGLHQVRKKHKQIVA